LAVDANVFLNFLSDVTSTFCCIYLDAADLIKILHYLKTDIEHFSPTFTLNFVEVASYDYFTTM